MDGSNKDARKTRYSDVYVSKGGAAPTEHRGSCCIEGFEESEEDVLNHY